MNSATVVKVLMYRHLQNMGVKNHGPQNDILLFKMQQRCLVCSEDILCC